MKPKLWMISTLHRRATPAAKRQLLYLERQALGGRLDYF
jgi:hypothetical protein